MTEQNDNESDDEIIKESKHYIDSGKNCSNWKSFSYYDCNCWTNGPIELPTLITQCTKKEN